MTLDDFLALFDYSVPAGNGFNVECPAHIDNVASLSVTSGKKGIVMKCQAGCTVDAICKNLGLDSKDLFFALATQNGSNGNGSGKTGNWHLVATHEYKYFTGFPAYEVLKWNTPQGKQFTIRWKTNNGQWINGSSAGEYYLQPYYNEWRKAKPSTDPAYHRQTFPALTLILYRWPEWANNVLSGVHLIITEGEKDADRAWAEGFQATTNTGGANRKWAPEYSKAVNAAKIVIIPDEDAPGLDRANRIAESLEKHAKQSQFVILRLPGLPPGKKDLSDWFDAGHTADELRALIDAAFQATQSQQAASVSNPPPPPQSPPISASGNPQPQPVKVYNTTDMGNAERFVDRFGHMVRYCSKLGKDGTWLIWDGMRWQLDERLKIHKLAKEIVPVIYQEAQNATLRSDKERLFKWALDTEALSTRNNMVKDSRPSLAIAVDDLDRHAWLLNCRNGTLDLKTGQIKPHSQGDYLSKLVAFDYDENAKCPEWEKFLMEVQQNKQEMVTYIQKAVGYTLTGDVGEKCMFVLQGPPDTGKSTFVEMIQILIDEYSTKIQTQTLMYQRERGIPNDIAKLKGTRFVHASEAEEQERLAESRIKELTGGDTVCGCFKYGEEFHFPPTWKIWLSTNNKPKTGSDKALWNRLKLIPFTRIFTKDEQDKKLRSKLVAEMPGILRWAVEGCLLWQKEGLIEPIDVTGATGKYKDEQDIIGHFIDQQCELDPDYREMAGDLYKSYKQWCQDTGEYAQSQRAFGLKLTERGLTSKQATSGASKGKIEWYGIRLIPSQDFVTF